MFTLYSKENCQQCNMSKMMLDLKGIEYTVKMLDVDFSKDDILSLAPNTRSFPVIFKDSELIGGYSDLKNLLK